MYKSSNDLDLSAYVYELRHGRGRVLILDNEDFTNVNLTRSGNQADVREIRKLLKSMNFADRDIKQLHNGTASEMREMLEEESDDQELYNVDFMMCFIMSHGKRGDRILGTDENTVNLEYIKRLFNRDCCPGLKGKPKMFFIQACRGDTPEEDELELVYQ